ncbi:trimethylamine methyltransferase family protein [Desulfococcus sp.]|uniref:trimethylamine methyltransferase family protein n=1 Tax=Desulfococcus sp. TaxID=2025834 RepID=UPI0035942600
MYDRMQTLTQEEMTRIHDAAMDLLGTTGIAFNEDEALTIFKKNGFKVDGKTVYFTEARVRNALSTAPSRFTVTARNPEKSVAVGGDDYVFVPGYGAPFITLTSGLQRESTMDDYDNFCKLVQTSRHINMNGFMMVEPSDVPADTAHLDMIFSSIILCDKPFMGSPVSKQGARDCVDMAAVVWGGMDKLRAVGPVTVSLINSLSPLQFSDEMAGSLIELARANQACVIASLIMAGSSGPVTLAGVLALQTAEILAGLTLAQLVNPGAPVVYGSTSSAMDMKTGGLSIGCPELSVVVSATAQMARFYNLPSRSGGSLTDAHFPDAQAAVESTLALTTAARNGINFILHAAGILGSYISMSYEKFLIDEEVCGITRRLLKPMEITPGSIDTDMIKTVGIGGQYLTQPKTFQLCRTEFHLTDFMNRQNHAGWKAGGRKRIDEFAVDRLGQRLARYEKPGIDPGVEAALADFVTRRKKG